MGNKLSIIFATLTGLCFLSGLAILTTGDEGVSTDGENSGYISHDSLNTNKKRHIAGGILLSVSLLFAGLTFTVMTIKTEDIEDEKHLN